MFDCEKCPAVQYCLVEAQKYGQAAVTADARASEFERQEMEMCGEVILAEDQHINGHTSLEDAEAVEAFSEDTAMNLAGWPAQQQPLRGDFYRQEAAHEQELANEIKSNCSGKEKLHAHFAQKFGKNICGSTYPTVPRILQSAEADQKK